MKLDPHHAAGRTRSWREDEALAAWIAAKDPGVADTPTEGRSSASVALRPPSGPAGSDPEMPVPGSCGVRGGDNTARPVGRDTPDDTNRHSPTHQPEPEETP